MAPWRTASSDGQTKGRSDLIGTNPVYAVSSEGQFACPIAGVVNVPAFEVIAVINALAYALFEVTPAPASVCFVVRSQLRWSDGQTV